MTKTPRKKPQGREPASAKLEDLISEVSDVAWVQKTVARSVAKALIAAFRRRLVAGESVFIEGLGTFTVHQPHERRARDFKAGEWVRVMPRPVVRFRATTSLRTDLKDGRDL